MTATSTMFRCGCGRAWMIHTTGAAPKKPPCPECGKPGTQVPASSPLLPEIAKTAQKRHPETDETYRRRITIRLGTHLARGCWLITGYDLDAFGNRYGIKRKEIEP